MRTPKRPRTRWAGPMPRPPRRGRRIADCWRLLATILMFGSLISSIALAPAAPALASGQDCQNGQVWDETQQLCVDPTGDDPSMPTEPFTPAEEPTATETPTVEPTATTTTTPTPTATVQGSGLTIIVHKFQCPGGYDPSGQDANPSTDCATPEQGVQFNLAGSSTGYTSQSSTGDSIPGAVTFGGLQPDTYTITETPPPGTMSAFVTSCTLSTTDDPDVPVYPGLGNWSIQQQFDATATQFECFWYDIPAAGTATATATATVTSTPTATMPGSGITILVHKIACPAGYDANGQDADLATDCTAPQDGVQFNLLGQTTGYTSQTNTGDSIPGTVMFGGLEPDTYTIAETPPAGTTAAYVSRCVQTTTAGQEIPHYPTVTAWAIQYQVDENDVQLECWWYNVPSGDGSPTMTVTPTPTGTSTAPSTLLIDKWLCPAGYDPAAMGANPASDCATPQDGVQFNLLGQTTGYTSQTNTGDSIPGAVMFGGIEPDTYHVVETFPPDIESAFVTQCAVTGEGDAPLPAIYPVVSATGETDIVVPGGVQIACSWYNVPSMGSSDLTIHKQDCDVETYVDDSSCTPNTSGVTFELYRWDGMSWLPQGSSTTDGTGTIALSGVTPGDYKVVELGGTWCHITAIRQDTSGNPVDVLNPDGSFQLVNGFETVLTVSNCTGGYGDITIYKWTCPPGYDYGKYGADPKTDCTQATNGVQFNLNGQTKGYTSQTNTGDSINGAVSFGSIPTDTYTVTETVPAETWYVFVWDCTGSSVDWVNPTPLNVGNVLNVKVANGDRIVCNWYNVPNPTAGDLTVYKAWCSGPKYVSDVDCTIYEKGISFTVNVWNGSAWVPVATQTTNTLGYIALSGLTPGTYQIVEQGATPCNMTATQQDPQTAKPVSVLNPDRSVTVTNGRETVVTVYNCTPKGGTPPPTKTPGKFPNTGADPAGAGDSRLLAQDTQVIEPGTPQTVEPPQMTEGSPEPSVAQCAALTAADNAPLATPQPDESCARGQVPASIAIPAIQVQATFEVKEIVGGVLQEPTDENVVTWYKNSNRLGETGNIVVAGHLNYWGVPEAVFFKLNALKQGDLITITGADGGTYTYAVTSVRSVPIAEGPAASVAPTDRETLTLMTCGGEWDSTISEYDSRTVVTAVRVPNPEAAQGGA